MKNVHYIGFYIAPDETEDYIGNVPGMLKMRYVAKRIIDAGGNLNILSLATTKNKLFRFPEKVIDKDRTIYHIGSLKNSGKISKYINHKFCCYQFKRYLKDNVADDDIVVMYHTYNLSKLMAEIKQKRNFTVISEIEEIYGYAAVGDKDFVEDEKRILKGMDGYIAVNDMICSTIGENPEKCVVSYGVCDIPKRTCDRWNDGYVHVVYAGTIEAKKRGAYTAIEAAEYLPDNYKMHILGFGNKENLSKANELIDKVNDTCGSKKVEYHGMLSGNELSEFLFKCHIGLSSNVMRPNFANNTFPSKVITYMCHDLSVVLGYAKAFDGIELSENWSFFYDFEPKAIADAIVNTKIADIGTNIEKIKKCDNNLIEFLKRFL